MANKSRFLPSQYKPPILTDADLHFHPRAAEYIAYMDKIKFPLPFQAWLKRYGSETLDQKNEQLVKIIAEPFCRSPLKKRLIK